MLAYSYSRGEMDDCVTIINCIKTITLLDIARLGADAKQYQTKTLMSISAAFCVMTKDRVPLNNTIRL